MVKLRSPLNSPAASGTIDDKVTYFNTRGKSYAKFKQRLPISRTTAQADIRDKFKEAIKYALELSEEEKKIYAALYPYSASCPWYNNFIGAYIKEPFEHGKSIVKSIQFVEISIPANSTYGFKSIDELSRVKSALINLGNNAVVNSPAQGLTCAEFYSDNIVAAYVYQSNPTDTILVNCLLIEFNHNYVKSRQHVAISLSPGALYNTWEIEPVDLASTVLFPGGCLYTHLSNIPNWFYGTWLVDATHLRADRNIGTGTLDVWTTVVDFI